MCFIVKIFDPSHDTGSAQVMSMILNMCRNILTADFASLVYTTEGNASISFTYSSPGSYQLCSHLVGQVGQQVEDKVSHPLDELLQGLKGGAIQHKLLRLQIDHHLINI